MRFRTKLAVLVTMLLSIVYGIAGTLLIYLAFQKSLDMEMEKGLRSYQTLRSTLVVANNISEQSEVEDVTNVLSKLSEQGGDWSSLRLYQEKESLFKSNDAFVFDDSLAEKCTETRCI